MKSALFIDFDNVYSSLRRLDPAAAEVFAVQPINWMRWLTDSLMAPSHAPDGAKRRLLVRRCYLNPQAYQRFRPAFNRAGFEIIDCPPMTSEGKTSTDIHMVLDVVDLLQHEVHYDEFIVFSADADFTPLLRKLRRSDRRTTVLAVGFPSAAYQASADLLVDQDEFIRFGLGFAEQKPAPPPTAAAAVRSAGATVPERPAVNRTTDWGAHAHLFSAIQQVHIATGMPLIAPREMQGLLGALVTEVANQPFALSDTGKRVRDRCRQAGLGVSRADVSYVLKGILIAGHEFGMGHDNVPALSSHFIKSMRVICAREQISLDEAAESALREWSAGAVARKRGAGT